MKLFRDFGRVYSEVAGDYPPSDLPGFVAWFAAKLNAIPEESRADAKVLLLVDVDHEGVDSVVDIEIRVSRSETDEEVAERERRERVTQLMIATLELRNSARVVRLHDEPLADQLDELAARVGGAYLEALREAAPGILADLAQVRPAVDHAPPSIDATRITRVWATIDPPTADTPMLDVSACLRPDGGLALSNSLLKTLAGGTIAEGDHVMLLRLEKADGRSSNLRIPFSVVPDVPDQPAMAEWHVDAGAQDPILGAYARPFDHAADAFAYVDPHRPDGTKWVPDPTPLEQQHIRMNATPAEEHRMPNTLTLIRGLPGSGKSTRARKIVAAHPNTAHIEADMFFEGPNGYRFDAARIREAHEWCRQRARDALAAGRDVVVANTFTQRWELAPYYEIAAAHGARVVHIECEGRYENTHGVPDEHIRKMAERWEPLE